MLTGALAGPVVWLTAIALVAGMNLAMGAMTGWGKTWTAQALTEQNREEFEAGVLIDYKDEFAGLVEAFDYKRLTVPQGAHRISRRKWRRILQKNPRIQLARAGATTEQFRQAMADVVAVEAALDRTSWMVLDEAHKLAPERESYPDAYETLATTWHGDGIGACWLTQRFAKLSETILACCGASMLGGFQSTRDLKKIEAVEYPVEVHHVASSRVSKPLPSELTVDGEPLTLRRFTDDDGHTIGSEWVHTEDGDARRIDTREWSPVATHYGSDRKRIKIPE